MQVCRRTLSAVIVLLFSLSVSSQHVLRGFCKDGNSGQYLVGALAQLMLQDSTEICRATSVNPMGNFAIETDTTGVFLLKVSMRGYEASVSKVTVPMPNPYSVPVYKLSPKAKVMDEVVVKGVQHDVTMKKDTLIFNATSFVVPEGYSIRSLLSQFPGLEITGDKIKYNGKDVNYFLINGKEYMMNQPKVALDNLPADVIDTVKVYGYTTTYERLAGDSTLEKPLAIDLSIKKEHRGKWMLNAGVSGGSKGYYRVRGFATKILPCLEATLYGSSNNYKHPSDYYGGNMWSEDLAYTGHGTDTPVGANLRWENGKGRTEKGWLELTGKVDFSHHYSSSTFISEVHSIYENQLENNSVNTSVDRSRSKSLNAILRLDWNPTQRTNLEYSGSIRFFKNRFSTRDQTEQYAETDTSFIKSRDVTTESSDIKEVQVQNSLLYTIGYNKAGRITRLNLSSEIALPQDNVVDGLQEVSVSHTQQLPEATKRFTLYNDRYDRKYSFCQSFEHSEPLGKGWNLAVRQSWSISNKQQTYDYNIDGMRDEVNSFMSDTRNSILKLSPELRYTHRAWRFSSSADITGDFSTLRHQQGEIDTLSRWGQRFYANYGARCGYKFSDRQDIYFSYSYKRSRPSLLELLPIMDTREPMSIRINNSARGDNFSNNLGLAWSNFIQAHEINLNVESDLTMRGNSTLHTSWYDQQTGMTTIRNVDVRGMWNSNNTFRYSMRLGMNGRFRLGANVRLNYSKSRNSLTNSLESIPSVVHGWELPVDVSLRYTNKEKRCNFNTLLTMNQYWGYSEEKGISTRSSLYAVSESMTYKLPWKLDLTADVGMKWQDTRLSRNINKVRTLANMNLSRTFLKNNALMVKFEWHDIFNANDRWETVTHPNWVSSLYIEEVSNYIMLHVYYQISL